MWYSLQTSWNSASCLQAIYQAFFRHHQNFASFRIYERRADRKTFWKFAVNPMQYSVQCIPLKWQGNQLWHQKRNTISVCQWRTWHRAHWISHWLQIKTLKKNCKRKITFSKNFVKRQTWMVGITFLRKILQPRNVFIKIVSSLKTS